MKVLVAMILVLVVSRPTFGESIDLVVGNWKVTPPGSDAIKFGRQRPFVGSFEFSAPPGPLQPVLVSVTLEVPEIHPSKLPQGDWEILVFHDPRECVMVGDSLLQWLGPHRPGDIFTSQLQFTPLVSGRGGFMVYLPQASFGALKVYWCLDLDGRLTYLGNPENSNPGGPLRSTFFRGDSVHFPRTHRVDTETMMFDWEITVSPLLRIQDTSTIHIEFTALEHISDGVGVTVLSNAMEIVNIPHRLNERIAKDQTVIIELNVVPKAVRDVQTVIITLVRDDPSAMHGIKQQRFMVSAIFDKDGNLRYIHDGDPYSFAPDSLLPSGFRPATWSDGMEITVPTSGPTTRYRRWLK